MVTGSNVTIGELSRPDDSSLSTPTKSRLSSAVSKMRHRDTGIFGNSEAGRGIQTAIAVSR
jgi:hypothetical protein